MLVLVLMYFVFNAQEIVTQLFISPDNKTQKLRLSTEQVESSVGFRMCSVTVVSKFVAFSVF